MVANINNLIGGRLNPIMHKHAVGRLQADILKCNRYAPALALGKSVGIKRPLTLLIDSQIGVWLIQNAPHFQLRRCSERVVARLELQSQVAVSFSIDARQIGYCRIDAAHQGCCGAIGLNTKHIHAIHIHCVGIGLPLQRPPPARRTYRRTCYSAVIISRLQCPVEIDDSGRRRAVNLLGLFGVALLREEDIRSVVAKDADALRAPILKLLVSRIGPLAELARDERIDHKIVTVRHIRFHHIDKPVDTFGRCPHIKYEILLVVGQRTVRIVPLAVCRPVGTPR